jgi:YHS domain-containing protein
MIKDLVCGMRMTAAEAVYSSEYAGVVYRFCSEACKGKFDRDPGKFAGRPTYS